VINTVVVLIGRYIIKVANKMISKNGYPIHVEPKENEAVVDWVERFKKERTSSGRGDAPTLIDFSAHGIYQSVSFADVVSRGSYQDVMTARKAVNALLLDQFQPKDYFVTHDLRVWFSSEEQATIFKICF
jgi:hypothetical protein